MILVLFVWIYMCVCVLALLCNGNLAAAVAARSCLYWIIITGLKNSRAYTPVLLLQIGETDKWHAANLRGAAAYQKSLASFYPFYGVLLVKITLD
jgi:hypothetical protein